MKYMLIGFGSGIISAFICEQLGLDYSHVAVLGVGITALASGVSQ